ncbi:hypothetical protein K439DRAFT_1635680 [Ramaria rubella]|nr:hypothetical protein K439DRAFT_1635680 [Ramaria rubella]
MSSNIGSVLGLDVGFPGPYPIVTTGSIPPPPFRHSTDYNKPIFVTESLSRNASLNFNPEECDLATGPGTTNRAKISGSEIPLNSLPQEPGEFFEDPLSLVGEELHHHEGYDDEDEITRKNTDPVLINHNRNPTTPTTGLTSSRTLPSSRASSNLVTPSPAHGTSLPDNNGS